MMDPTAKGDLIAEKVRAWYEANRETWWARHKPGIWGTGPDRTGEHSDDFMLELIDAVHRAGCEIDMIERGRLPPLPAGAAAACYKPLI